jgi:hypothetical protein
MTAALARIKSKAFILIVRYCRTLLRPYAPILTRDSAAKKKIHATWTSDPVLISMGVRAGCLLKMMHTFTHTHTHTNTHTHTHTHSHRQTDRQTDTYIHKQTHRHKHTCNP